MGVRGYDLYQGGKSMGTTTSTSRTFASLACGQSYTLAVDAFDAAGNKSSQTSIVATTSACADTQAPTDPTGLFVTGSSATTISLSWSPSFDNVAVSGYGLYVGSTLSGSTTSLTVYTFSGLSCGTAYSLSVDAYDAAGNRSGKASVTSSTTPCADTSKPTQPTGLAVSGATTSALSLAWTASTDNVGVAGYRLYQGSSQVGTTSSTNYQFTGLTCGTSYTLGVAAYDASGNVSSTATATSATSACPVQPPSGSANVYVSPSGNDSTCGRGDASKPCASFQRAYDLSQGGDLISVAAGSYPNQQVVQNGHSQSGPMTTFRCVSSRACVINGEIDLGAGNGSSTGIAPSYLTFDGFDFQGFFASYRCATPGSVSSCATAQYLTVENSWVHGWNRGNSGESDPLIGCCASHFTVTGNEIGPECCSGDGDESGGGDYFTFTDNYVHDLYDTCRTSGTTRTPTMNRYGSQCQGVGYGDTAAGGCTSNCSSVGGFDHVDGMQLQGGTNVLIARNRFYNAGLQGIFMENANGQGYHNVTIQDNAVSKVCGTACGNDVSLDSNTNGGIAGTIKVLYNTVQGVTIIGGGSSSQPVASGSTVIVAGNIFGLSVGAPNGCGNASGVTYIWSHNLVGPGQTRCGPGDTIGAAVFASASFLTPDLNLSGPQTAVDGGENVYCGPAKDVSVDIDGRPRPAGAACDIGAYEEG
jgi:chitodextrinase